VAVISEAKGLGEAEALLPKHRHLPHIDLVGHYQFITFRTFDSVDDFVKKLSSSAQSNTKNNWPLMRILINHQRALISLARCVGFFIGFSKIQRRCFV